MSESSGGARDAPEPAPSAGSLTHGFLFADLRGYTSYLDRRGALAAADLLTRFRHLVRGAVAVHHGAEIRTEGDSFYVVFPSASMAVACALDIVRAAGDEVIHRDDIILVGVGVHAGEAVDTPDGPVGTAVNIAARLCAMAGPGEVVVSDTVRALTRSVGSAGFVSLGRRPIKGLDESLSVYRAVPAGSVVERPSGRRRRLVGLAAGAAGGVVVLVVAVLVLTQQLTARPVSSGSSDAAQKSSAGPSPRSSTTSAPVGRFSTFRFAVPYTISLGPGWSLVGDRNDLVAYGHDLPPAGWIDVILVAATLDPPCSDTDPKFIGGRPEDIIDWLATRKWLNHGPPRPYNVGPYLGRAVEIEVPREGRFDCHGVVRPANMFRLGEPEIVGDAFGALWGAEPGERKLFVAIDVDGRTVTLVIGSPFFDVEAFWRLSAPLLQTIEFTKRAP